MNRKPKGGKGQVMLTLHGKIENVFRAPAGTTKEGKDYGGDYRVQIQAPNPLRNGETRIDLFTMSVKNPDEYKKLQGQSIRVAVGAYVYLGSVAFFIPDGAVPEMLKK